MTLTKDEVRDIIKEYIKDNLSIVVDASTERENGTNYLSVTTEIYLNDDLVSAHTSSTRID